MQRRVRPMKVFVSYARANLGFVDQLALAVERLGYTILIDREGISPGDDWRKSIGTMILSADAVVVVLSKAFLESDICQWEIEEAERRGKKMIPIVCDPLEGVMPGPNIADLNHIYFYEDPTMPGSGFGAGLTRLDDALQTDSAWLHEHTHLEEMADRWMTRGEPTELLLRGSELKAYQNWQRSTPLNGPALSSLQKLFLEVSVEAEERRVNKEMQRLSELDNALTEREGALQREEVAQQKLQRSLKFGFLTAIALTALAVVSGILAHDKSFLANQQTSRMYAAQAQQLNDRNDPDKALLFSLLGDPVGSHRFFRRSENTDASSQLMRAYMASTLVQQYIGHEDGIGAVAVSHKGDIVATASGDGTARLWQLDSGEELAVLKGHKGRVTDIAFTTTDSRVLTSSADGTIKIWSPNEGTLIGEFKGHEGWASTVKISDTDRDVFSAAGTKAILWDLKTGQKRFEVGKSDERISALAFDERRNLLLTGDEKGEVQFWSSRNGTLKRRLQAHETWINSLELSPDGQHLLTCSGDGQLKLWDMKTITEIIYFEGHITRINDCTFSPDGQRIASASGDGSVREWDRKTGALLQTRSGHENWVYGVAYTPSGDQLVSGAWDNTAKLWQTRQRTIGRVVYDFGQAINNMSISPNGDTLLVSGSGGRVGLFPVAGGRPRPLKGHEGRVVSAISPDGQKMATADQEGRILITSDDLKIERSFNVDGGAVRAIAFGPDSREIAMASADGHIRFFPNAASNEPILLQGHEGQVNSVAFSKDGRHILSGGADAKMIVWDREGNQLRVMTGTDSRVQKVRYSPDNHLIATAAGDTSFKLWDTVGGTPISTMMGHSEWVYDVAFSPNGQFVASASEDGTVKLWSIASGQMLASYVADGSELYSLSFSQDGTSIFAGGGTGKIWTWDVDQILFSDVQTQVDIACDRREKVKLQSFTERDMQIYPILRQAKNISCK